VADSSNGLAAGGQGIAQWRDAILDDEALSSGEKLVAMAVARFADCRSRSTFTAAATMARLVRLSERGARQHLLGLIAKGYLRATSGPKQTRAWKTRELFLLMPPRAPATVAAPIARAPATVAAPIARAPANSAVSTGKKQREHRQRLPTIPIRDPDKEIPGEPASAGRPGAPAAPLAILSAEQDLAEDQRRRFGSPLPLGNLVRRRNGGVS